MSKVDNFFSYTYKKTVMLYTLLFFCLVFNYLSGDVLSSTRQYSSFMVPSSPVSQHIENTKFSDFEKAYIPEIISNTQENKSSWLPTWSKHNELGRPISHLSGFSQAYFPSYILMKFVHNPWKFITALSLITCYLSGIFVILFCRESNLHPISGLIVGVSIAASPLFSYWLTFPVFISTMTWGIAVLWSLTRMMRRADFISWSALTFSVYSLLMTAYPQVIVYFMYMFGGYVIYTSLIQDSPLKISRPRFFVMLFSSFFIVLLLVTPTYLDLIVVSASSVRGAVDVSFFLTVLPQITNFDQFIRFIVLATVPEVFGNSIKPDFPYAYNGLSITLLIAFFTTISMLLTIRKEVFWWGVIAIILAMTLIPSFFVFIFNTLPGFNLSRSIPLGSLVIPLVVINAIGIDTLIKLPDKKRRLAALTGFLVVMTFLILGMTYALTQGKAIYWHSVILLTVIASLLGAYFFISNKWPWFVALSLTLIVSSYPLQLKQAPDQIIKSSALTDEIRYYLGDTETRYAVIKPRITGLYPNMNVQFNASSIHTYNSLSSYRYHNFIEQLGGDIHVYGRHNQFINPDFASAIFWMSNIGLVLSPIKIDSQYLTYLKEVSDVYLYRVIERMGESQQIVVSQLLESDAIDIEDPRELLRYKSIKTVDKGDLLEFQVTKLDESSVFLLSQVYNQFWRAEVFTETGWQDARTVEINGVFQGVFMPKKTSSLRLKYSPWVKYAWIAHVFFLILILILSINLFRNLFKTHKGRL